jgi:hypothetical protein
MARRIVFRSSKSIAGAVLVGFGMFILYENLARAVSWLGHALGANSSDALGLLPAIILTVSQVLRSHAADHQRFVEGFLQHMLVSSWPILLVMLGTILSRGTFTGNVNTVPRKDGALVDLIPSHSTFR